MHFSSFIVYLLIALMFTFALVAATFTPGAKIKSNPGIGIHAGTPGVCEGNQGNCIEASGTLS